MLGEPGKELGLIDLRVTRVQSNLVDQIARGPPNRTRHVVGSREIILDPRRSQILVKIVNFSIRQLRIQIHVHVGYDSAADTHDLGAFIGISGLLLASSILHEGANAAKPFDEDV